MKEKTAIIALLVLLSCSCFAQEAIEGFWIVDNAPGGFRGTKTIEVINEGRFFKIVENGSYSLQAFFDKEAQTLYFVYAKMKNDESLGKVVFGNGILQHYILYENRWVKNQQYKKKK